MYTKDHKHLTFIWNRVLNRMEKKDFRQLKMWQFWLSSLVGKVDMFFCYESLDVYGFIKVIPGENKIRICSMIYTCVSIAVCFSLLSRNYHDFTLFPDIGSVDKNNENSLSNKFKEINKIREGIINFLHLIF